MQHQDVSAGGAQPPRGALLVGSVPLPNAQSVFNTVGAVLGSRLHRIPDGETGERSYWMLWQFPVIGRNPGIEMRPARLIRPFLRAYGRSSLQRRVLNAAMSGSQAGGKTLVRIKPGIPAESIRFGPLGYAAVAKESYQLFARLKREGAVPPHLRFQVSLPTPLAPLDLFSARDQARLLPAYEVRLLEEVNEMATAIPPAELGIQWDTAVEFAMLEGVWPSPFGTPQQSRGPIVDMLERIGNGVPRGVELGS